MTNRTRLTGWWDAPLTFQDLAKGNIHKKVGTVLVHIESLLISASAVTGCVLVSAFASLVGIPIGITSFAIGLKTFAEQPQELKL